MQYFLLSALFGVGECEDIDLLAQTRIYKGRLPNGYLPIGRDAGGNIVCISLVNANYGKVYFWNHEEELNEVNFGDETKNIYYIADNFDEFIDSLGTANVEDDNDEYEVNSTWIKPGFLEKLKSESDDH